MKIRLLILLSEQLDIPYVDLSRFELDAELVTRLPETLARRHRALVLKETADGLLVGMGDPTDIFAFDELVRILKAPIQIACVKESDFCTISTASTRTLINCATWPVKSDRTWQKMPSTCAPDAPEVLRATRL